jgi:hypothetical protein
MPIGPSPIGGLAFVAIKFAGYSVAGYQLRKQYETPSVNHFAFGAARTIPGIIAGVSFASLTEDMEIARSELGFFLWLLPVRLLEWLLVIWLFFQYKQVHASRLVKHSFLGALWSYVLDAPAIGSVFVVPGGMWVCQAVADWSWIA